MEQIINVDITIMHRRASNNNRLYT